MDERLVAAEAALKANDSDKAIELLCAAITDEPKQVVQVYRVLLRQLWRANRYKDGAVWGAAAAERFPKDFDILNLQGVFLRRTGRFDEAIKILDQAQRLNPKDVTPLVNKGNIYNDLKNGPAAEAAFSKLVRLQPRAAEYQRGLARALWNQKKFDAAGVRLRQAISLKGDYVDAWLDLAGLSNEQQDATEAVAVLDRAMAALPGEMRILEAKASILRGAARYRESEQFLLSLLPELDDKAWVHHQLARAICDYDRPRANDHFRRAVALEPDVINHQMLLAESLERTRQGFEGGHIDEAYKVLLGVMEREPLQSQQTKIADEIFTRVADYTNSRKLGTFQELGRNWATTGRQTALLKHLGRARSQEDRLELIHQHKLWGDMAIERAKRNPVTRPATPRTDSKIRVGFMSSDLRGHPVAYFALPLFEHYDRDRFELYCYSYFQGSQADGTQKHITSLVENFRWRPDVDERGAAQMIADDQLDILFELGGSTHMNKIEVMAYKPARLSVSWLGYPHSAGLTTIDYLMVDPFLNPTSPDLLIEDPLIMPRSWIALGRLAFPDRHEVNPIPPVLRTGVVTFGTANNPYKYSPEMLRGWAQVLSRVPGSRFLFVRPEGGAEAFRANIRGVFAEAGVTPDRILFNAVRGAHMPFYNDIDIALDTFPQTGGTTTCEAAWMGVPTVSLTGHAIYERLSYSILNNAGLGDLCADTFEGYVETAVKLAADRDRIAALRSGLRDQLKASPLGQTEQFAEDFYDLVARTVESRLGVRKSA